jgi:ribosomal protein L7/L12
MQTVEITGWLPGCQKVGHTKLIQERVGLPLSKAKAVTDAVLSDQRPRVELPSQAAAEGLIQQLEELGFSARLVEGEKN